MVASDAPTRSATPRAETPVAFATATTSAWRRELGQQHAAGEGAGADHADAQPAVARRVGRRRVGQARRADGPGVVEARVAQQDAERRLGRAEQRVGVRAGVEVEGVGRQPRGAQAAGGHQAQDLLEVAALGPAHVAGGVVDAVLLVGRVVAAGAVGAGDDEPQLLGEQRRPRRARSATSPTMQTIARSRATAVAVARGAEVDAAAQTSDGVRAAAVGAARGLGLELGGVGGGEGAGGAGERDAGRVGVDADARRSRRPPAARPRAGRRGRGPPPRRRRRARPRSAARRAARSRRPCA